MWKQAGRVFTRLTVLRPDPDHSERWICECECGTVKPYWRCNLTSGNTRSCGCLQRELTGDLHRKHGMRNTPEFRAWCAMRDRCFNPKNNAYHNYGAREIGVHPAWVDDFQAFYDHVGPRPSPKHSLDRIENDGNYEPGNTQWATKSEQASNRRVTGKTNDLPKGVSLRKYKTDRPYVAQITYKRVYYRLGQFSTPEAARAAYLEALEWLKAAENDNLPIREDRADVR